jgi:hypothetical protein
MAGSLNDDAVERADLVRLLAATHVLLAVAERIDGDLVDEALLADLHELRDRAESALRRVSER